MDTVTRHEPQDATRKGATRRILHARIGVVAIAALIVLVATLVTLVVAPVGSGAVPASSGATAFVTSPTISLSASSVSSGASITISGTHFGSGASASVTFVDPLVPKFNLDGYPAPYNKAVTATVSSGAFTASFSIPSINAGSYEFVATDGGRRATAAFTVTSGSKDTTFSLHPASVAPGGCVVMKGTNFYPGDVENVYIGPWSNSGGYKSLHGFDDSFTTGAIHHMVCFSSSVYAAGSYGILVVGDTSGTGTATLTIT